MSRPQRGGESPPGAREERRGSGPGAGKRGAGRGHDLGAGCARGAVSVCGELLQPGLRRSPARGLAGGGWAQQGEVSPGSALRCGRGVRKHTAAAPAPPGRAAAPRRAVRGRGLRRGGRAWRCGVPPSPGRRTTPLPAAPPRGTRGHSGGSAPCARAGRVRCAVRGAGRGGAGRAISVQCRRRRSAVAGGRRCRHVGAGRGGPGPGHHPGLQVTPPRPVPLGVRCRRPPGAGALEPPSGSAAGAGRGGAERSGRDGAGMELVPGRTALPPGWDRGAAPCGGRPERGGYRAVTTVTGRKRSPRADVSGIRHGAARRGMAGRDPPAAERCLRRIMRPDDANIAGNVHGGTVLKMIEEAGAIISTRHCNSGQGVSGAGAGGSAAFAPSSVLCYVGGPASPCCFGSGHAEEGCRRGRAGQEAEPPRGALCACTPCPPLLPGGGTQPCSHTAAVRSVPAAGRLFASRASA